MEAVSACGVLPIPAPIWYIPTTTPPIASSAAFRVPMTEPVNTPAMPSCFHPW